MKALPSTSTQSADATAVPAWTREPRHQGCESATRPRAALVVVTGISAAAQKAAISSPALDQKLPLPASTTGREAALRASSARSSSAGEAAGRVGDAGKPQCPGAGSCRAMNTS